MPEVLLNVACTVRPDYGSGMTKAMMACLAIAMNLTTRQNRLDWPLLMYMQTSQLAQLR